MSGTISSRPTPPPVGGSSGRSSYSSGSSYGGSSYGGSRPTPPSIGGSSSYGGDHYSGGSSSYGSRPTPPSSGSGSDYPGGSSRPTPPSVGGSGGYYPGGSSRPTPPPVGGTGGYYPPIGRPTPPPVGGTGGYYPPIGRPTPPPVYDPTPWYYTPRYYPFPLPSYSSSYSGYGRLSYSSGNPYDIADNFLVAKNQLRAEYYASPMTSYEYDAIERSLVSQAVDQLMYDAQGYSLSSRLDALRTVYNHSEMTYDEYTRIQSDLYARG